MKKKEKIKKPRIVDVPSYILGLNVMFYIYFVATYYHQIFTFHALILNTIIFFITLVYLSQSRFKKDGY